jgi:hypothetical protein
MRRRELLLAAAGLLALPAPARAAGPTEGDVLGDLIGREQAAVVAYGAALRALGATAPQELVTVHAQESAHADALATLLAAVGLPRPRAPRPQGAAAQLAAATDLDAARRAAVALEQELVAAYKSALPQLPDPKIAMSAATILASHAQHRLIVSRDLMAAG